MSVLLPRAARRVNTISQIRCLEAPILAPLTLVGALVVGCFIGLAGIGGIFLIPLLVLTQGLSIQASIGTCLVTFVCTGLVGTALYARRGVVDWRVAGLTSAGSLIAGPFGAVLSVSLPEGAVKAVFATFLAAVGIHTLRSTLRRQEMAGRQRRSDDHRGWVLVGCGLLVGLGSGLTGVGGPVILVPLLLVLGMAPALAVGASQVNQVAASVAGATGHLLFGEVDLALAAPVALVEVIGVYIGVRLGRQIDPNGLRVVIALLCLVVAAWTVWTVQ